MLIETAWFFLLDLLRPVALISTEANWALVQALSLGCIALLGSFSIILSLSSTIGKNQDEIRDLKQQLAVASSLRLMDVLKDAQAR